MPRQLNNLRLDLEDSVFSEFPRTQSQAGPSQVTSQNVISDYMVQAMYGNRGAERATRLFTEVGRNVVRDFSDHLVKRLINAGPHVLDIKYGIEYDPVMRGHVLRCASPVKNVTIETLRYPRMVQMEACEPDVSWRPSFRTPPLPAPTFWQRAVAAVKRAGEPLKYDGPYGAAA